MRATACGTGGDKLLGTLPRNENQACVDRKVPQEGKAKREGPEVKGWRKEDTGRNGRELSVKDSRVRTKDADPRAVGSADIGRWMAGLGELGPRAWLRGAVRSKALCGCLNIH